MAEWAEPAERPRRWTVLDAGGAWLGDVRVPERFLPLDIGDGWILGVEADELKVEYVVLYPLKTSME